MILLRMHTSGRKIIFPVLAILIILAACTWSQNRKGATSDFDEGAVLVQKRKCDEGIEKYKKGLRKESRSAVGYNFLGMAYRCKYTQLRSLEWRQREIEAFKKAIELDPQFYLPYINLGTTYYDMGNLKEAALYFRKALEIFPEHPSRKLIEGMIREGKQEER